MEARNGNSKTAHGFYASSARDGVPIMRAYCGHVAETAKLNKDLNGSRQCARCAQYLTPRVPASATDGSAKVR